MATTYDIESNPIEDGVQQVYTEIRDSLGLILGFGIGTELMAAAVENPQVLVQQVLTSLDDAISNNWDDLMVSFWKGVKEGIETDL